jgi:RimJ/RimL family protein N-acetyltransferase
MTSLNKFYVSHISKKYIKWLRNKNNTKYTTINNKISKKEVVKYVSTNLNDPNSTLMRIVYKKKHVGNIRIYYIQDNIATLGILIGDKKSQSKGIGSQSIALALKILKKKKIKKVLATIDPKNIASIKIFKKNGFKVSKNNKKNYYWLN